ncbi:hypothetical protein BRADI_1g36536v3 [Brachypodium distachyon]|uniref:Uncharacterized protein n=1 Tax=Brachypodium distachyon TaxID=15368 RepID=A0A2K2DN21_BRADI|nr:hypothetical protein BRADI_1g36536v3 [Brachypodium distachyon]
MLRLLSSNHPRTPVFRNNHRKWQTITRYATHLPVRGRGKYSPVPVLSRPSRRRRRLRALALVPPLHRLLPPTRARCHSNRFVLLVADSHQREAVGPLNPRILLAMFGTAPSPPPLPSFVAPPSLPSRREGEEGRSDRAKKQALLLLLLSEGNGPGETDCVYMEEISCLPPCKRQQNRTYMLSKNSGKRFQKTGEKIRTEQISQFGVQNRTFLQLLSFSAEPEIMESGVESRIWRSGGLPNGFLSFPSHCNMHGGYVLLDDSLKVKTD